MDTYQIPKVRIEVILTIHHDVTMKGSVFLSENLFSYTGAPRLEDFLNLREERFFPFKHEGGDFRLVNKRQVVYLKSSEKNPPDASLMPDPLEIEIVFSNGDELEGLIYPNLPKDTMRASDFLNQKEMFLPLYSGDQKIIFNTERILYIKD